ncbi:MAG TPA: serine hydrolase [Thermoanaerobaculia bacterium]|nr:serine hydrolase [Thermoanaerobaculia bacterium]
MTPHRFRAGVQNLRALVLILVLTLAALPAAAASAISNTELAQYADRLLAETYPADQPGATALVVRSGETVLRKGYGLANLELGVPMQPDMVLELGSVTKQFTGAAILMLQDRGQLSVNDEVTKYLPDYPTHGQKITLDHLLTHVSGIPSYTGLPEWSAQWRQDITVDQLIALFKDKPLEFAPGEKWSYNNSAYVLLGAVIEKVSGKTYEDFIEQEIFAPLGMKRASYVNLREIVPGRASGYDKQGDKYLNTQYLSMSQPYSAGALMSNVDDLALWDQALSNGKLLKKESLDRMFTPVKLNSGMTTKYGYGWAVWDFEGTRIIEHGGDIFGFSSQVTRVPAEKLLVVVLTNNPYQQPRPDDLALRITAKALGRPLEDRKAVELDPKGLDDYVGVYRFDKETARVVSREGDKLFVQRTGGEKSEILASGRDTFFYKDSDGTLRFRRDAQGKIAVMELLPRFGPDAEGPKTDEAPPAERQAIRLDPAIYDAYAGTYELAPTFQITVTREGDRLLAQATGQPQFELFPASETRFFLKVVEAEVEFQKGPDGKAASLTLYQGGREVPGKRVR